MSVILIGMPSSGKSTVGVILAKRLGYRFIDSDLLIQEREGRLLSDIIADKGVESFLRIEEDVNSSISEERAVISTGGSAVYGERAMESLKKLGKVVYLEISYDEMVERLGDYEHRGIVMKEGKTLRDIYEERRPLYERYADVTVTAEHRSITRTVEEIERSCKMHSKE